MDLLRYPIGQFEKPATVSPQQRKEWLESIANFPKAFEEMALSLSLAKLQLPYRQGGWTAEQVVHHVPDSHMNAYLRFKWSLSEENPMIKAYDEVAFANLGDYRDQDIQNSLDFLHILHKRWIRTMQRMKEEDWKRTYQHPQDGLTYVLEEVLGMYVWHGNHHLGHLKIVAEK
ncbi:MAG: YfiT family bacillithiol transferase [Bacteroidota bacterium]